MARSTKIEIRVDGRNYTVKFPTIGSNFATVASIRIGKKLYESDTKPFGFTSAALNDLFTKVQRDFPGATLIG